MMNFLFVIFVFFVLVVPTIVGYQSFNKPYSPITGEIEPGVVGSIKKVVMAYVLGLMIIVNTVIVTVKHYLSQAK